MSNSYVEYLRDEIRLFKEEGPEHKLRLLNETEGLKFETVLDVGCGAGQEMLAFAERENVLCVGIDINPDAGKVVNEVFGGDVNSKAAFTCSKGEDLPFGDETFDVVICRVTLPLMNNKRAISEISRVLKTGGVFFLKTHTPIFYFWLFKQRLRSFSPDRLAYPIICFFGGVWHAVTGNQLESGFWKGKEIFQTKAFLRRELTLNNMRIVKELSDSNRMSGSYMIVQDRP